MLTRGISRERLLPHRTAQRRAQQGSNGRLGRKRMERDVVETKHRSIDDSRMRRLGERLLQRNVRPLRHVGRWRSSVSSAVVVQTATDETRSSLQIDRRERSSDEPIGASRSFPPPSPKLWGGMEKIRSILLRVRFPFPTRVVPFPIGTRTEDLRKIFLGKDGSWLAHPDLGFHLSRANGCHVRNAQDRRLTSLRVTVRGTQVVRLRPNVYPTRSPPILRAQRAWQRLWDAT